MGQSYPAWDSVDVFVLSKKEGLNANTSSEKEASGSHDEEKIESPPELRGPFSVTDVELMQTLSSMDSVHFAYVLSKADVGYH
jgi:hypothetical protein